MDQAPLPRTDPKPRWFRTWKLPLAIWAAAAAFIAYIAFNDETFADGGMRALMYFSAIGGAIVLTSAWFGLLSTFSKVTRQRVVLAEVISIGLFWALFKIQSVGGNIWPPHIVPRWWSYGDYKLPKPTVSETPSSDSLPGLADYPAFLGPNRHAVVTGIKLARDWDAQPPRKLWRQAIGAGWSGFSVIGTAAVMQEQRGDEELVVCYDLPTGKVRWVHADKARFESILGGDGPRATPTILDGRVYTVGSTGMLNCLDLASGQPVWKTRNVIEDVGSTKELESTVVAWGRSGSPLIVDDRLIVPGGGPPLQSAPQGNEDNWKFIIGGGLVEIGLMIALMKTRRGLWLAWMTAVAVVTGGLILLVRLDGNDKAKFVSLIAYDKNTGEKVGTGGNQQISYSSPSLFTIGGVRQIVIVNETTITGHDAATLKTLWSHPWLGGSSSNASTPQTQLVSPDTLFVSKGYGVGAALFKVSHDDGWVVKEIWHNLMVLRTKFSNCVISGDHIYGLDDGVLECVELATGNKLWKNGRYGSGQILLAGDVLLVQAESGEVVLVEDNPKKFIELTRFQAIEGKSWSNPTLAGRYLLVRNAEEAACYELPVVEE